MAPSVVANSAAENHISEADPLAMASAPATIHRKPTTTQIPISTRAKPHTVLESPQNAARTTRMIGPPIGNKYAAKKAVGTAAAPTGSPTVNPRSHEPLRILRRAGPPTRQAGMHRTMATSHTNATGTASHSNHAMMP